MSSKYSYDQLTEAVKNSNSVADVMRYFGLRPSGGNQTYMRHRLMKAGIDISHFSGQAHNKGRVARNKKTPEEILVVLPAGSLRQKPAQLRRAMIESGIAYRCECGLTDKWQGTKLTLEVDHINQNWLDNRLENLRFLCPNCHSQK